MLSIQDNSEVEFYSYDDSEERNVIRRCNWDIQAFITIVILFELISSIPIYAKKRKGWLFK
jgi:hypothetical protein